MESLQDINKGCDEFRSVQNLVLRKTQSLQYGDLSITTFPQILLNIIFILIS